jgi:hypothetical protein
MMWGQIAIPSNESFDISSSYPTIDAKLQSNNSIASPLLKFAQQLLGVSETVCSTSTSASSILVHPNGQFLAIVRTNVVNIYMLKESQMPVGLPSLNLSRQRVFDAVNCLEWTYESRNSFLLGTTDRISYCLLPNIFGGQHFDATNVEIKQIALSKIGGIDLISASPQGRLFACSSSQNPGLVYIGDAWMGSASILHCIDRSDFIQQLCWMEHANSLVAINRYE